MEAFKFSKFQQRFMQHFETKEKYLEREMREKVIRTYSVERG
jgi:hypothetical protein